MIRVVDSSERGYDNYQTRKKKKEGIDLQKLVTHPRKGNLRNDRKKGRRHTVNKTRLAISITLSSRVLGSDRI